MQKINSYYPTLGQSWALIAVFMACSIATSIVIAVFAFVFKFDITNSWITAGSYVASFILVAGFICLLQRNVPTLEHVTTHAQLPVFLFLLLLIFTPLVSLIIEPITSWLPMPDFMEEMFDAAFQKNVASLLMAVIAAPLCEEWLCRGVIMKGLLRHSTPTKAILWSALIFAVIHMNPWQALPAFIIGLLLGYVYWKTGSLWPCIFIHFVNNGLSFLLLYLFPDTGANSSSQDMLGNYYWWIYLGAWLLVIPVGYALYKVLNKISLTRTVVPCE